MSDDTQVSSIGRVESPNLACEQSQNIGHNYPQANVADRGHLHQGDQHNHFHYYYPVDPGIPTNLSGASAIGDEQLDGRHRAVSPSDCQRGHASSSSRCEDRCPPVQAPRESSSPSIRASIEDTPLPRPVILLPHEPNPRFINRPDEWQSLSACFFGALGMLEGGESVQERETHLHRRAALYGLSGVGKTQLAIHFAHEYRKIRPDHSIFWMHASTEEWLRQSFQKLADLCEIAVDNSGQADVFTAVGAWLKNATTRPWLMILDNADDAEMLFQARRRLADAIAECPHGALLVTTRNKKVAERITHYGETIHVKELDQQQCVQLLHSFLSSTRPHQTGAQFMNAPPAAQELVKLLGYLPLAVAQAAAFIKENSITVDDYVSMWQDSTDNVQELLASEFEADGRQYYDAGVPNAVGTTMMLSLDHLQEQRPRTGRLLICLSLYHYTSISPAILLEPNERLSSPAFVAAMGDLYAFSLLNRDIKMGTYEMHRLVHQIICIWRSTKAAHLKLEEAAQYALVNLNKAFPLTMSVSDRQAADTHLPHALQFLNEEHKLRDKSTSEVCDTHGKIKLMTKVAEHLLYQGRTLESKDMRHSIVSLCETSFNSDSRDALRAKCELAQTLEQLRQFNVAKRLCTEIIQSIEPTSTFNRTYINSLRMLGKILSKERSYDEALTTIRQAKTVSSRYLGEEHEETLILEFTNAEILQEYALHCPERSFKLLGDAQRGLEQAVDCLSKHRGSHASATILGKQHLTNILDARNEWQFSERLGNQIIASKQLTLGKHHLETFQATMNLALCFIKQFKLDEAEETVESALKSATAAINNHHLGRARALQILASIHEKRAELWRKRLAEGEIEPSLSVLAPQVLETPSAVTSHPPVTTAAGPTTFEVGKQDPVNTVNTAGSRSSATQSSTTRCIDPPLSQLPSASTSAVSTFERAALAEYQEALRFKVDVVEQLLAAPGIEHPLTLNHIIDTTKTLLHLFLSDRNSYGAEAAQAEKWQRDVLAVQADLFGDQHEDTMVTRGLLAVTLKECGKAEEAEPFAHAAFKHRVRTWGKSHRETLAMHQVFAEVLHNQPSSRQQSMELMHYCYQLSHQAFGPNDPDTKARLNLWQEWKGNALSELASSAGTNSVYSTMPSMSTSRILQENAGITRMLTHNTLRFTVPQSSRGPSSFQHLMADRKAAMTLVFQKKPEAQPAPSIYEKYSRIGRLNHTRNNVSAE